jgi:hypothetical protein
MRNLVGVLVAAAVGIHCSGTSPVDTSELDLASHAALQDDPRPSPSPARSPSVPHASDTWPEEPRVEVSVYDLSSIVHYGTPPHVTSAVFDAMGATYATGTFVGEVVIGDTLIRSRGNKDVFLVKLNARGGFEWVRAFGSTEGEKAPHVTIEDELREIEGEPRQRVTIVGMTKGEMDCGTGPLNTWDSSTFFVCIFGSRDGMTLNAGVFPTGNP